MTRSPVPQGQRAAATFGRDGRSTACVPQRDPLAVIVRVPGRAEKSSWSLANALDNEARIDPATGKPYQNQVLDEAWSSYPWLKERPPE